MQYIMLLFTIIICAIFLFILERIENRLMNIFYYKLPYGKELEKLIRDKYKIERRGFGPWWLLFKESDRSLRLRAMHEHLYILMFSRVGDPGFETLPKWL